LRALAAAAREKPQRGRGDICAERQVNAIFAR
jgi:hypothetical protein